MRTQNPAIWHLLAACCFLAPAQGQGSGNVNGQPPKPVAELPGFVYVKPGKLQPGCDAADYKARHQGNQMLKMALIYDIWGTLPPLDIPAFYSGKFEVTNAQWKLYMDGEFRVEHKCNGIDTLASLAKRHVRFRSEGIESEWRAIYGLNAASIMKAIQAADIAARKKNPKAKPMWGRKWTLEDPDPDGRHGVSRIHLPEGLKLVFYAHRVPSHWYGWCALSGLRVGREYVDVTKSATEAFTPPANFVTDFKLRAKDFSSYPMRDASPAEMLVFAEWAGCHLPSEYENERAIRLSRANTDQHPFPGSWNHRKQKSPFAWVDNVVCAKGPLPVDDPGVAGGDTSLGARHVLGNVWEMTRTFWDFHPIVRPKPPAPVHGLFNYALVAKGGSFGDGWRMIQISTRTGLFGKNDSLDLVHNNRVDTVGLRLVRHPQPGYDLLRHSILRLTYARGRGNWVHFTPLHFNMFHMAGMDTVHITPSETPYIFIKARAKGVAFAPMWISNINKEDLRTTTNRWRQAKQNELKPFILGVLRSDRPIRAGVRLNKADAKALQDERKRFKAIKIAFDRQQKKKKKNRKPKKGAQPEKEIVLPPKPVDPDHFELATEGKNVGLWREASVPPGQWLVVYWNGFIGLANKAMTMPPDAILALDGKKAVVRKRQATFPTVLTQFPPKQNKIEFSFSVEEQLNPKKSEEPPEPVNSPMWSWCEVHPQGWRRRAKISKYSWDIRFTVPFAPNKPIAPKPGTPENKPQEKTEENK